MEYLTHTNTIALSKGKPQNTIESKSSINENKPQTE
jgi:hypothetical protein